MKSKICLNCNTEFCRNNKSLRDWNRAKYCSRVCSCTHSNKTNPRRMKEGHCICGVSIPKALKFCSSDCRDRHRTRRPILISKSQSVVNWRIRTKQKAIEYKGGMCQICSYSRCARSLTFHHNDPNTKDFGISDKSWSWEKLRAELDKCTLLCSNCHGELHDGLIAKCVPGSPS